jgi:SAM-dependent methyltransferase
MKNGIDRCFYCHAGDLRLAYGQRFHQRKKDHGPYDLFVCGSCGSAVTLPTPSAAELTEFYQSLDFGLTPRARGLLAENPDAASHDMIVRRLIEVSGRASGDVFTWIDVGAGAGEIAGKLASHFPAARGIAIDIHEGPPALAGSGVEWRRININDGVPADQPDLKADLVCASAVWEHVPRPDVFARNVLSLLRPGGVLYMMTPNYGSMARRLLGTRWPYFAPGEHLCMPTPRGARICLRNELDSALGPDAAAAAEISARSIRLQYSAGFVAAKLGLPLPLARPLLHRPRIHLPSGAMESVVRLKAV